ncbi:MAG: immunoglobulin domain-containing protein [Verrucomicrobia bacterium]|nr:immunoglobulin domain-containing protein [Verrucomicrobiota bacterium]
MTLTTGQAQTNYQQILSFGASAESGRLPRAPLMEGSDGGLYGTTFKGGTRDSGTLFKISKDGSGFVPIYSFTNNDLPHGGLVEASDGALCGTTSAGGTNSSGTVFKCNKDGTGFTNLHVFSYRQGDGTWPVCSLVKGKDGMLYGTTYAGGVANPNQGTVFGLNPDGSGYRILHNFTGTAGADGSVPRAGLYQGLDGALYGTTLSGGSNGFGTVFKISPDGSGYTILHHFSGKPNDGSMVQGGLVQDSAGLLYGTTYYGGTADVGTIFKLDTDGGSYALLRSFTLGSDGNLPFSSLVVGSNDVLYGTTEKGGLNNGGTVFRVNRDGTGYAVLHRFSAIGGDGNQPLAPLLTGSDGALYGSTYSGGVYATNGTLFRLLAPPAVTTQPQSVSVTAGSNVTFTVAATGTSPLSYQWQFNSVNIPGATGSSYMKSNVETNDAGLYSVVVTNFAGSVTSSNATLTVNVPPAITSQPQSVSVGIGSTVTFTVTATGTSPLSFQWRFNSTNLAGATASSYTCDNVQITNVGSYSVVVSNVAGTLTSADAVLALIQLLPLKIDLISLMPNGQIQLQASGPPGSYAVEASPNLADWVELTNLTTTGTSFQYVDSETNLSRRFYRLHRLPLKQPIPLKIDSINLMPAGQIQLQASGPPGHYAIEATTNLADWAELTNFITTGTNFQYLDSEANLSRRFYRVHRVP